MDEFAPDPPAAPGVVAAMAPPARPLVASGRAAGYSLRLRLNAIVAVLVVLFFAALVWLRIDATRASVLDEIVGSNRVATQLLRRVSWIVANGETPAPAMFGFLEQLGRVRANDITLVDRSGTVLYRSPAPTYKEGRSAPAWFSALVAPPPQRMVLGIGDATLAIEADPSRAILDGWDEMVQLLKLALVALVMINVLVFWLLGRTVKPFTRIIDALETMRAGDYTVRLPPLHGREAGLIGESVNRLGETIEGNVRQRIATHTAERRLAESREWARRVEESLESERREIAAELHDELGQSVTAIRTLARSVSVRLPEGDQESREATRLIESEAARLYDAMHGMIPRLTPLDLGPFGLPDALNDLVVSAGRLHPQIRILLHVENMDGPVDAAAALVAYRVAQEGINNAIKHSGGQSIRVSLARAGRGGMTLAVEDDGRGIPPPESRTGRFGLTGLRERVLALGGTFDAGPVADGGSRILARLPLEERPA